jgi:hypothetical protein
MTASSVIWVSWVIFASIFALGLYFYITGVARRLDVMERIVVKLRREVMGLPADDT